MLLPARMTRILLGGHVSRMEDAIEALHQAGVLHLEDFDGAGHTDIGTPLEAGDEASALLVRVRGLQKAIGAEDMPPRAIASGHQEEILSEAEAATRSVLDDAASVRAEMAIRQAEIAQLEPFTDIHVDLSLVGGLDSVKAYFGTARERPRLAAPHELESSAYGSGYAVALFVRAQHRAEAEKALQEAGFTPATLPTGRSGTPSQRLLTLYAERKEMEARLQAAEARIEQLRHQWGPKLAALEGSLTEQVQKTQAPLRFGVTERTFHAEGWVPRRQAARLRSALSSKLGSNLYYEELGDGQGSGHAHGAGAATVSGQTIHGEGHGHDGHAHEAHGDDGHGHHSGPEDEPPVALENPKIARPYQFLLSLLGRPRYGEIDPTTLMLIFFPLFFGLMVGDVALGLLIILVGLFLKNNKVFGIGGHAISRALIAGGIFSVLAGAFIFGEALGMHFVLDEHSLEEGEYSWEAVIYGLDAVKHGEAGFDSEGLLRKTGGHVDELGHDAGDEHSAADPLAPADEGASTGTGALHASGFEIHQEHVEVEEHAPAMFSPESFKPHSDVHLQMGPVPLGFYSKTHDAQALLQWAAIIGFFHIVLGLLLGIRNVAKNHGVALAIQEKAAWLLLIAAVAISVYGAGDGGRTVLAIGLALAAVSIVLLWMGAAKVIGVGFIALLEIPALGGNILSYTRLAAIGASKAGMAIAFASIAFETVGGGDIHSILGWTIYLVSSLLILVLAIIAGTLQSLRLQFVEFFGKFYEGGGRPYVPFGRRAAQG